MNKDQLGKNVGRRLRLRPEPRGWHGSIIDGDWILEAVAETVAELRHVPSGTLMKLGIDHIHEYMTDPSGNHADGFLVLHVDVRQQRDGQFVPEPIVPRRGRDASGVRLTHSDFSELATLINRLDQALKDIVRESASERSRLEASRVQTETQDWVSTHVGPVAAASFMAAVPDPSIPAGLPSEYAGLHQRMRGRLTHLIELAQRIDK